MAKKVTTASTKKEILDAYNQLLEEKLSDTGDKKEQPDQKNDRTAQKPLSVEPSDKVMKDIADLRIAVSKSLDQVEEKLVDQNKVLGRLREAIQNEKAELENTYGIRAETESLAVLIEAQQQKKAAFEQEMTAQREQWKLEKQQQEKDRKREEEEYNYRIKRQRAKDEDAYNENKTRLDRELKERRETFEKEIQMREAGIKQHEDELNSLRDAAERFPGELQQAIGQTEKSVTQKLTAEFKFEKTILEKDFRADLKLKDQIIKALEQRINELNADLKSMQLKVESADRNVKDIVLKAIESNSDRARHQEEKSRISTREIDQ